MRRAPARAVAPQPSEPIVRSVRAEAARRIGNSSVAARVRRDRAKDRLEGRADEIDRVTTRRGALMYVFGSGEAPYFG